MEEKRNKRKISKEDIKVVLIFLANVIALIVLIGVIIYLVWGNNGISQKSREKKAEEKLNNAVQAFANEEYENVFDAIQEVEGYEKIEETGDGTYKVTIDEHEMILTQHEVNPESEKNKK